MNKITDTLRLALIAAIGIGLIVGMAGPVTAQDDEDDTDDNGVDTANGVDFEENGVELDATSDSIEFEDNDGTDLEIDSDGNIDLETPEGVDLETTDDGYELDGAGLDYEAKVTPISRPRPTTARMSSSKLATVRSKTSPSETRRWKCPIIPSSTRLKTSTSKSKTGRSNSRPSPPTSKRNCNPTPPFSF